MSRLTDYFRRNCLPEVSEPPLLPLIHTTEVYLFNSILNTGTLKTNSDNKLYLFYGRPAFVTTNTRPRADEFYFPVSLLVQPTTVDKCDLVAIYPFDSGAFTKSETLDYIHQAMKLKDFELGTSLDILPKLVSVFFGNNERYCTGKVKDGLTFDIFEEAEVEALYQFMKTMRESDLDDRRFTSEIQLGRQMVIQSLDIIAVVLPTSLMANNAVQKTIIEKWGAIPITYYTVKSSQPLAYKMTLLNHVMEFYKLKNFM